MKNLANLNIEFLDELPINFLSLTLKKKHQTDLYQRCSWRRSYMYHKTDDVTPYDRAERLLQKNIGKSFSDTFSTFCKKVPKCQQFHFLDQFEEYSNRRGRFLEEYSIDDNDNIVYNPPKRRINKPSIQSKDYNVELQHKITGHNKENFSEVYEQIPYEANSFNYITRKYDKVEIRFNKGKFLYYEYNPNPMHLIPIYLRYRAKKSDFIPVVVSGWKKTFSSRNDPEFKQYQAEKLSRQRKLDRENNILKNQIDYESLIKNNTLLGEKNRAEMRRKQIEAIKKEEQANLVKIISHGFDPLTSFRN